MTLGFSGVLGRPFVPNIALGALLSVAVGAACDEGEKTDQAAATSAIDVAPPLNPALGKKPEDVKYDATISGLERFMRDLRVAIQSGDEPATGLMLASLRLPNPDEWMKTTFGDELGKTLAEEYKPQSDEIGQLAQILREQFDKGLTTPLVGRFQTSDNPAATGYQAAALGKMKESTALYSVRLVDQDQKQRFHIWSFVHANESFRFVGKMRAVAEKKALGGRDLNEYRVSDAERLAAEKK